MAGGKELSSGRRGGTTKKNAFCSFCRKSYRDVGPLVEGPGDVYICGECIDLCQSILGTGAAAPRHEQATVPRDTHSSRDRRPTGSVCHRPGCGQEGAGRGGSQPLQASGTGLGRRRRRHRKVEHSADWAHRFRQDIAGPNDGPHSERALCDRRRHDLDRSRLRWRRRRELAAQVAALSRFRHRGSAARRAVHR